MAKTWRKLFCVFTVGLLTYFIFIHPAVSAESVKEQLPLNQYGIRSTNPYVVDRVTVEGKSIDKVIVPGPPHPPAGFIRPLVANLPVPHIAAATNTLANVPAMEWVFGCSATSAAMMFGYYDNSVYTNMYTGTTNGGLFPMTNAAWGHHDFGNGDGPMALCPLSATRMGDDGRAIKGHVDDYWIKIGNTGPDPYITGPWTEHTQGECTGDFMGTNQSKYGSEDGSTWFYNNSDGSPLYDFTELEPSVRDGCHGLKLFVESRGYTVRYNGNFSQYILGSSYCSPSPCTNGFTYADFKAEIDAGRPVLIQVAGHTMLGFGYDDTGSTISIHDTWDYLDHSMTWGGIYSGMQHYGVTVLRLTSLTPADMSIAILGSPSSIITGNNVTYTITVTNNGPNGTTNAIVINALPANVIYVSATPDHGSCSGTSTVVCNLGTIANTAQATVTLVVAPTVGGTSSNTAIVTSDLTDTNPADNTATASTTVNNPAPSISSLSPSSAIAGSAAFTLTVNGSNFVGNSTVQWGGAARTTTFVSFTRLTAAISAADIATVGTVNVTVVNPTPGGGTSTSTPATTFTITGTPAAAKKTSGNMCFIATAAFGSPLESHVQILRDFRDRILLNSSAGKAFIDFYYKTSPAIADKIAASEGLRLITRAMLMPVIGVAYLIVHLGMFMTMLLFTVTLLTVIFTILMLRKKIRKSARAKAAA